jgi:barbiturase
MPFEVRKVEFKSVNDASGLAGLIDDGVFAADDVVAVIGKTEGNGGVNDYTRILADQAFRGVLMEKGSRAEDEVKQIPMAWSGGCDGVITPHAVVFARVPDEQGADTDDKRLSVGFAMSDVLLPEDIGRPAMVEKVGEGVKRAMAEAGITDVADVHYVQTKTPLLVQETIADAHARGETVFTEDTLYSMDVSNGTTGLGVAYGLGEIDEVPPADDICKNTDLYSAVASCSSGVELDRAQIVVVGNAAGARSKYRVGHSVMKDAIDQDGIWDAIRSAGLELPERPHHTDLEDRLVGVFLKCEADASGQLRGRRQLMLDDSDVHHHRQIKGAVGGVTAATVGDSAVFVSVGALHQGPQGGGPVAAIVRVED